MSHLVYSLPAPGIFTGHGAGQLLTLRDAAMDKEELIVQVRSGDYLATLATALDSLSGTLTKGNEPEAAILQKIVDNLLYLDQQYKLVKK